ncbi:MAG TPA: MJ1477/TM1410 family putative glycoside hydrolase [Planctomycetota bacterium]|nr:MJ1477/TM1410 family putative glycoside hydrolase [Planctomycetota bacterium]
MRRPLLLLALLAACSSSGGAPRAQLAAILSWCCWLQAPDVDQLAASPYAFVVIDYSRDGSAAGEFSRADIDRLHAAGKTALAYLSLGEAEDYRFYWDPTWPFLSDENPDWPGNYAVEFWDDRWWDEAIGPYLDRILAAGFDGVYLDRVDAYWWWHEEKGVDARLSADRMAALVERVAQYARTRAGAGFVICPQNGLGILDDASAAARDRYVATIDAVGIESLYFNYVDAADQAYRLAKLDELDALGKRVFLLEYVDPSDWTDLFARVAASGLGMVGYPAAPDAMLDELVLAP